MKPPATNGYTPEQCRRKAVEDTGNLHVGNTVWNASMHLVNNPHETIKTPLVRSGDFYIGQNVISKDGYAGTITHIEAVRLNRNIAHVLTITGHNGGRLVTSADSSTLTATDTAPNQYVIREWVESRLARFKIDLLRILGGRPANHSDIVGLLDILYQQWLTNPEKHTLASWLQETTIYHSTQTEGETE
jgi:hypothetical protein